MKKKYVLILLLAINNFPSTIILADDEYQQELPCYFDDEVPVVEEDDLDEVIEASHYEITPHIRPTPLWFKIVKTVGGKIFLIALALISKCKKTWHSLKLLIGYVPHYKK